jgi:hypothetical protein
MIACAWTAEATMARFPNQSTKTALSLVCLFFLVLTAKARGDDRTDLLSIVRAQHRAARESIRTLSANVTSEVTFPKKRGIARGNYWRFFNTVRVQEFFPNGVFQETLVKDGEIRTVGRPPVSKDRSHRSGAERRSSATFLGNCDAWRYLLIEFIGPSEARYDFDHFIALAKSPPRTSRDTIDGHDCIRISMKLDTDTGKEWSFTFWHDIECNYLIRKEVATFGKEDMPTEYEVLEFLEAAAGMFVPICARLRSYDKGKLRAEEMFTLSSVHVNEDISKDMFVLPAVPAGTMVYDRIEGTRYPVDKNWERIGTAVPLEKPVYVGQAFTPADENWNGTANSSEGVPLPGQAPATNYPVLAQEDPESIATWILPVSVAIAALAAACACWILKLRRAR